MKKILACLLFMFLTPRGCVFDSGVVDGFPEKW